VPYSTIWLGPVAVAEGVAAVVGVVAAGLAAGTDGGGSVAEAETPVAVGDGGGIEVGGGVGDGARGVARAAFARGACGDGRRPTAGAEALHAASRPRSRSPAKAVAIRRTAGMTRHVLLFPVGPVDDGEDGSTVPVSHRRERLCFSQCYIDNFTKATYHIDQE
jgi:hypothetical protein